MKIDATVARLRQEVVRQAEADGGRLPTERALASRLAVSRGTLRRALDELERSGAIWRGVGRGTYLRGYEPQAVQARTIPPVATPSLTVDTTNPTEVMEARLAIEPEIAAIAALKATPAQIAELETTIAQGRRAAEVTAFEPLDSLFHRQIARTAGNSLLLALFDALNAARDGDLWGRLKAASLTPERIAGYSDQHQAIAHALRDRDRPAAAAAMRDHLQAVRRNLLGG